MPYLTQTENLKLQLSPGLVASYDLQPGNGVGLFWDKHTHVYLLTYLPRTYTGHKNARKCFKCTLWGRRKTVTEAVSTLSLHSTVSVHSVWIWDKAEHCFCVCSADCGCNVRLTTASKHLCAPSTHGNDEQWRWKQTRIGMASILFPLPFFPFPSLFSSLPLALSLPFPTFFPTHSHHSPSLHPSLSLRSRTRQIQLRGLGERCKLP